MEFISDFHFIMGFWCATNKYLLIRRKEMNLKFAGYSQNFC